MKHTAKALFDPPIRGEFSQNARRPANPIRRRHRLLAVAVGAAVAAGLGLGWLLMPRTPGVFVVHNPRVGEVVRVARASATLRLSGSIKLPERRILSAPESGVLQEIRVRQGQRVSAGDPVFVIDPSEQAEALDALLLSRQSLRSRYARAQEALVAEAARNLRARRLGATRVEQASQDVRLQEQLHDQGLASDRELAASSLAFEQAQAALEDLDAASLEAKRRAGDDLALLEEELAGAEHRISAAERRLEACRGASPVDGVVVKVYSATAVPGAWVNRFQPLVEIAASRRAEAVFDLALAERDRIQPGQGLSVEVQGRRLAGTVAWVGAQMGETPDNERGGAGLALVVSLDGSGQDLVPGTPARVTLVTGQANGVLALPVGPYLNSGKGLTVYRVEGSLARKVVVKLNDAYDGLVAVEAGLAEGDRVILSGSEDYGGFELVELDASAHNAIEKISPGEEQ